VLYAIISYSKVHNFFLLSKDLLIYYQLPKIHCQLYYAGLNLVGCGKPQQIKIRISLKPEVNSQTKNIVFKSLIFISQICKFPIDKVGILSIRVEKLDIQKKKDRLFA